MLRQQKGAAASPSLPPSTGGSMGSRGFAALFSNPIRGACSERLQDALNKVPPPREGGGNSCEKGWKVGCALPPSPRTIRNFPVENEALPVRICGLQFATSRNSWSRKFAEKSMTRPRTTKGSLSLPFRPSHHPLPLPRSPFPHFLALARPLLLPCNPPCG